MMSADYPEIILWGIIQCLDGGSFVWILQGERNK